jgi:hypothetical protein
MTSALNDSLYQNQTDEKEDTKQTAARISGERNKQTGGKMEDKKI